MQVAVVLLVAVGAVTGSSLAASQATTVCYQVGGPYASWSLAASVAKAAGVPQQVKGTTWTAFATGVRCQPKAAARKLLAKYPAARRTATNFVKPPLAGFKECVAGNGEVVCENKSQGQFALLESGSYSLGQIRQLVASGTLAIK